MKKNYTKKRMSVIIPAYNRADSLPEVLSKLLSQQKILKDAQVIVVDDGSIDNTKQLVKEFIENSSVNIRYLYQQNTGAAAARNLGIKEAQGEIIFFLDSDIIPSEALISEHLKFHEKYPQYNFALRGSTKTSAKQINSVRIVEIGEIEKETQKGTNAEYIELCWADFYSGNISLKRQFLLENGIFDEEMRTREDIELGYRLGKRGLKLFYNNKAMGFHLHPVSLQQHLCYAEEYGKSLAIWYSKTPDFKKDLLKIGRGNDCGFLSWKEPLLMIKYFLRIVIVSKFTVKLVIFVGNILKRKKNNLFRFYYRQAYQYYHRKAFKKHLALIRKGYIQINTRTMV
ncbi:glycosyltransferase family 2 protein [Planctomycetota bacterium]